MKAYLDKTTGLWKWGTRGEPKYNTSIECQTEGLRVLVDRLREIRDKVNRAAHNHGK